MVESGYVYNPANLTLEHYYQEPADYDWSTSAAKVTSLKGLASCKFSYSDGTEWKNSWEEDNKTFPRIVKITFRFEDDKEERDFLVNIPISE